MRQPPRRGLIVFNREYIRAQATKVWHVLGAGEAGVVTTLCGVAFSGDDGPCTRKYDKRGSWSHRQGKWCAACTARKRMQEIGA